MKKTNEYILYDDYAEIVLISPKYGTFKTQIDLEDVERCKQYYWGVMKCYNHKEDEFYPMKQRDGRELLHRYIMNYTGELNVDHRDGKTFNNRKYNLRICSRMENAKNRKMNRNNSSGVKGVSWNKVHEDWVANICVNGKKTTLGNFQYFDEAVEARKLAEEKYHKEFNRHAKDYIKTDKKAI